MDEEKFQRKEDQKDTGRKRRKKIKTKKYGRNSKEFDPNVKEGVSDKTVEETGNDIGFYSIDDPVIKNAGSLFFNQPVGREYLSPKEKNFQHGMSITNTGGIMILNSVPTWGSAIDANSPLNVIALKLLWAINYRSGRNPSYNQDAIMRTFMLADYAWCCFMEAKRIYGVINKFSNENEYLAEELVTALGWNYRITRQHLHDLRSYYNVLRNKLNVLFFPNIFNIHLKHMAYYSNIYIDADSTKAQFYAFKMDGSWFWDTNTEHMEWKGGVSYTDPVEWFEFVDSLISDIQRSEFYAIIMADIQRRFNAYASVEVAPLEDGWELDFTFDLDTLCQIQNAEFIGASQKWNFKYELDESNVDILLSKFYTAATDDFDLINDSYSQDNEVGSFQVPNCAFLFGEGTAMLTDKTYNQVYLYNDYTGPSPSVIYSTDRLLLKLFSHENTAPRVIENSRFMYVMDRDPGATSERYKLRSWGDVILYDMEVWQITSIYNGDSNYAQKTVSAIWNLNNERKLHRVYKGNGIIPITLGRHTNMQLRSVIISPQVTALAALFNFTVTPRLYFASQIVFGGLTESEDWVAARSAQRVYVPLLQLEDWALVSDETIERMNYAAIIALMNPEAVPQAGTKD